MNEPRVKMVEMREYIANTYGLPFVANMPPRQVAAVYNSMIKRERKKKEFESQYKQMTLIDWILERKGEILWDQTT
jgi:hypothetical protein